MIPPYLLQEMAQLTGEHFVLVLSSMAIAVGTGLPLGVLLTRRASLRTPLLGFRARLKWEPQGLPTRKSGLAPALDKIALLSDSQRPEYPDISVVFALA